MHPMGMLWGSCQSRSWCNPELLPGRRGSTLPGCPGQQDPGVGESLRKAISWLQLRMAAEGQHQCRAFSWKIIKCSTRAVPRGSDHSSVPAELHSGEVMAHLLGSPVPVQDTTASHGVSTGGCLANCN